jgi:hypothetical protein
VRTDPYVGTIECENGNSQEVLFQIRQVGDLFQIYHPASQSCIRQLHSGTSQTAELQKWDCSTDPAFLWRVERASDSETEHRRPDVIPWPPGA